MGRGKVLAQVRRRDSTQNLLFTSHLRRVYGDRSRGIWAGQVGGGV
jgi:hypothetical protein